MGSKLPSAGSIRQQLRSILQDQILPGLRAANPPHLFSAQLPLRAPDGITVSEVGIPPLEQSQAVATYPQGWRWESVGVHCIPFPVLCCVLAGEIDLRVGVTAEMLKTIPRAKHQPGAYVVALPAPAYFVIPPGVPYPTGTFLPWERHEPQQTPAHLFWLRVLPSGALCHTTLIYNGQQEPQYSLLVEDELLAPMMDILLAALHPATGNAEMAHAQLLVLMLRVQQDMQRSMPMMTDGLSSRFPARKPALAKPLAVRQAVHEIESPILEKAVDYIQFHLHEPLTPTDVAHHLRLQPAQLNRLFRQHFNTSVMRYVVRQRMETAKLLLQSSDLPMQEVGRLVGYKFASHFSRAFAEHEGMPPLKYRQQRAP